MRHVGWWGISMNNITRQFIDQFEREHPGFASRYCQVADLYDADLDIFHIDEVQDEYEEFKQGGDCE